MSYAHVLTGLNNLTLRYVLDGDVIPVPAGEPSRLRASKLAREGFLVHASSTRGDPTEPVNEGQGACTV